MRELYERIPGPPAARPIVATAVVVVVLVVLFLVYDWIGTTLLDSGGTLG